MGLSASQARFLQLTARRNNLEYEAQQISMQRLSVAQELTDVSNEYNDKISNKKLMFSYTDSTQHQIELSYSNYMGYMNQQMEGLNSSQQKMFLVSTSGKIVVNSIEDMQKIIEDNTVYTKVTDADPNKDYSNCIQITKEENGQNVIYYKEPKFTNNDFVIIVNEESKIDEMLKNDALNDYSVEDSYKIATRSNFIVGTNLNNIDEFQNAIREGIYTFARLGKNDEDKLVSQEWSTIGGGAITEKLDETDDAQAQAKYEKESKRLELLDKKMQLELDEIETERNAVKTEMDSLEKVINDNIEKTFNTFS